LQIAKLSHKMQRTLLYITYMRALNQKENNEKLRNSLFSTS
jgi:hypothetical protein